MNPSSMFTRVLQQEKRAKAAAATAQHQQQRSLSPFHAASAGPSLSMNIDEEMRPFHSFLHDLQQSQSTAAFREEQLFKFFTQLRHSTPPAQIQALDMLSALLAEKPAIIIGCKNLLSLIVRDVHIPARYQSHDAAPVTDRSCALLCSWLLSDSYPAIFSR
jgi:hypothetical protein